MITFKQYISEIFSSSFDYSKDDKSSGDRHHFYDFKDHDDNSYRVHIDHGSHGSGIADVNFSKINNKGKKVFNVTGDSGRTSHRVLSTVSSILKDHASDNDLSHYTFTAKATEPSRVKLYDTITKRNGGDSEYLPYNNTHNYIIPTDKPSN